MSGIKLAWLGISWECLRRQCGPINLDIVELDGRTWLSAFDVFCYKTADFVLLKVTVIRVCVAAAAYCCAVLCKHIHFDNIPYKQAVDIPRIVFGWTSVCVRRVPCVPRSKQSTTTPSAAVLTRSL